MNITQVYPLGSEGASGELEHLLGQEGCFRDVNYDSTERIKPTLSMRDIHAVWVKNESGGTLKAGDILKPSTDSTYGPLKAVAGAAGATDVACGVVDPYINGTVADNDHFWMIVRGPATLLFTTGTTLAIGDELGNGAAGRAIKFTPGTTDMAYFVGYSLAAVDTGVASDTEFRAVINFRGA